MTEAEWLACTYPLRMLACLRDRFSLRQARLFAVACCRRLAPVTVSPPVRAAIGVMEQFATGLADEAAFRQAAATVTGGDHPFAQILLQDAAAALAARIVTSTQLSRWGGLARDVELAAQAALLRDVVGNPFRPVTIAPEMLLFSDGVIPALARAIDEEGAFDRLPILGDALEEAGCVDAAVLDHAHAAGPHVRGCWLIDVILGKG